MHVLLYVPLVIGKPIRIVIHIFGPRSGFFRLLLKRQTMSNFKTSTETSSRNYSTIHNSGVGVTNSTTVPALRYLHAMEWSETIRFNILRNVKPVSESLTTTLQNTNHLFNGHRFSSTANLSWHVIRWWIVSVGQIVGQYIHRGSYTSSRKEINQAILLA